VIVGKLWRSLRGQLNKLANYLWSADPIAQMRYEYDLAVTQLQEGREGLEGFRAIVERVNRQVSDNKQQVANLVAKVTAYLAAGDRESAARFAMELQQAQRQLVENEAQLVMHEQAYENNVAKIKLAGKKLVGVREKINKYDAELKMSRAESEMAKLAADFQFDLTSDFGQIEQLVHDKLSLNRAAMRVAHDLSGQPAIDVQRQQAMEAALAEQALQEFEAQRRLSAPATVDSSNPPNDSPQKLLERNS
jgi:phage shock protein A